MGKIRNSGLISRLRRRLGSAALVLLIMSVGPAGAGWENDERSEITIDAGDFAKLDTFEGHVLAKADKVFSRKDYRGALAEYRAFNEQYPKSAATAYVLLRCGRCLHLDNKRFEAVNAYNEVLDYFPAAVDYAGAALFYSGLCHSQNGDPAAAVTAWTEMVRDEDYRKCPLAAVALCRLGDLFTQQNKVDEAAKFYIQAAVDFRRANPDVARFSMEQALRYLIRTRPSESQLADFYQKVKTFNREPCAPSPEDYWNSVTDNVRRFGVFDEKEKAAQRDYYRYWSEAMAAKQPQDDAVQLSMAAFALAADGDRGKWVQRLDSLYAARRKPGHYGQVILWIRAFGENKAKVEEYYGKLNFGQMTNAEIETLIKVLIDDVKNLTLARQAYDKLQQGKWSDEERCRLADFVQHKDDELMPRVCADMADKDFGRMRLLRFYQWRRMADKALPLAEELIQLPDYAKEAYWIKGEMLQQQRKFEEAITAYRSSDRPPDALFRIADCFLAQGKTDAALAQFREIENFFKEHAPEAALRIAFIYRDKKDHAQYQANLRGLLRKYPSSRQSSAAHEELERMGVRIGGGVDAQ